MWICLNDAFFSVVTDRNNDKRVVVRARVKGHIEQVFPITKPLVNKSPKIKVEETPNADYRFRAYLPREYVADVIHQELMDIDYPNFKDSVEDDHLHDAYSSFWHTMFHLQKVKLKNAHNTVQST